MKTSNKSKSDAREELILYRLKASYSKTVVDHCLHPRNLKKMDQADGYARSLAEDGDMIEVFVLFEKNTVLDCTFQTNGCAATMACGSLATELVKNKTYSKALEAASPQNIIDGLDGLPQGNLHCAHLVSRIFRLAIVDGKNQNKTPWKRAYRRY